jgi:phytoene desaturase
MHKNKDRVIVIGAGFAGLAAACHLAKLGHQVTVLEKNTTIGGRARKFEADGFMFDMGPSWYWMPDVFERFFADFGRKVSDYYTLVRLDPSYRVCYGPGDMLDIPASMPELEALFEREEKGSAQKLRAFLADGQYKYQVGMQDFVHKPSLSITEFADMRIFKSLFKLQMFSSVAKQVRSMFQSQKLIKLLEFPVLFLGATPQNTPAMYSLMNYADMSLGTWYPLGGMHKIIEGMTKLATELGVSFELDAEVARFEIANGQAKAVITTKGARYEAKAFIASADYHHIEHKVLGDQYRNYPESYWQKRVMAPSSLLYYIGLNKKLKGLRHHNLFFDEDFAAHADEIYTHPKWPAKPLFYASVPSITDATVAPEHGENLFLLIPVAPGMVDTPQIRDRYFEIVMDRLESLTEQSIRPHITYMKTYAHNDFVQDYHAFKGNAYGLANTLLQTAFLKPKIKNKKVSNLYYAGQLTTPGPGVPPSLISGALVAKELDQWLSQRTTQTA